ncbi:hypothetical protein AUI46_07455 [archaeon 13_1_40CM_2_52_13]|nr:MAG: hypothetical protein AUI46_07455 [archaeon 13_1_40CM_2_52_13]TMI40862.1 MAG: hypothetical protein E6H21_05100 [Candidatus Bathyarchaeota archaeon]
MTEIETQAVTLKLADVHVLANKAFSENEKRRLADSLARMLEIEVDTATIAEEALDLHPIISFVWEKMTDTAFTLLLAKIGSELWKRFKRDASEIISKHALKEDSRIEFKFVYDGTEIWLLTKASDPKIIEESIDGLGLVLFEIRYLAESRNLPGTRPIVQYKFVDGNRWVIAGATEMDPDFAQYDFERPTWIELGRVSAETIRKLKES